MAVVVNGSPSSSTILGNTTTSLLSPSFHSPGTSTQLQAQFPKEKAYSVGEICLQMLRFYDRSQEAIDENVLNHLTT
jgi:hypothetical protein